MTRGLWVQVDVDMPTDDKLFSKPVAWRHLWTCLLCLSKKMVFEHGDPTIYNHDAASLNAMFNIGGVKIVKAAMTYFTTCKPSPMIRMNPDGSFVLINFLKRQGGFDPVAQREKWKDLKRKQRDKSAGPSNGHARMSNGQSSGHVHHVPPLEEEKEEDLEHDQRRRSPASETGGQSPPPLEVIAGDGWPKELLSELFARVSASRPAWRDFFGKANCDYPAARRAAGLREFLRRRCPEDGKGPMYLLGMIREGAGNPPPDQEPFDQRPVWEREGYATSEDYEAAAKARTDEVLRRDA